jgi:hypothetical protein
VCKSVLMVVGSSPSAMARRATLVSQWIEACPTSSNHAALLRRADGGADAPIGAEHLLSVAVEDVCRNVAIAEVVEDLIERDRRVGDVHHEPDAGQVGRLPSAPQRFARVGLVALPRRAVGDAHLDAEDEVAILALMWRNARTRVW